MRLFQRPSVKTALALLALLPAAPVAAQAPADPPARTANAGDAEVDQLLEQARAASERREHPEAIRLAERARALAETRLGRDHPATHWVMNVLAVHYATHDRQADAERLLLAVARPGEAILDIGNRERRAAFGYLLILYEDQGRFAEAEPLARRGLAEADRTLGRDHPDSRQYAFLLGTIYRSLGRYADSEALLRRALEGSERRFGRDHRETLVALASLATLFSEQERYEDAEPLLLRALAAFDRIDPNGAEAITTASNLAELYRNWQRFPAAEPLYRRALAARERTLGADHPGTLVIINNLALLHRYQGNLAEAERMFLRALHGSARRSGPHHPRTLTYAANLADLYKAQGRHAEAETRFADVLDRTEQALGRDHPDTILAATALAMTRLETPGPRGRALAPARLVVSALRSRWAAAGEDPLAAAQRDRERGQRRAYFTLLADAAWDAAEAASQDRPALLREAFLALQDAITGPADRAVLRMAVRRLAEESGPAAGALVREREELEDQWAANGRSQREALAADDPPAEGHSERQRAERERIEARVNAIDATLRQGFPQYFALVRPEAVDVATTQAMLAPDEAILLVVPTDFGSQVMAISRTDVQWARALWTSADIDMAVTRLLNGIRTTLATGGETYTYDRHTACELYRQIVAPVAAALRGKRHVFIAAGGSLASIPFAILVTDEPQGADTDSGALRTTHWFADAHALVQIPSIQSLQFLRRFPRRGQPSEASPDRFVGFGNPVLDGPQNPAEAERNCRRGRGGSTPSVAAIASLGRARSGAMLADPAAIRHLCPLPWTAVELENMRAAFAAPATALFLARDSTEARLRRMDLSRTRILAFATHGLVAGEIHEGLEPGLVLTPPVTASDEDDGFLAASEVSALQLDADWVILSACNTAAGDGPPGAPGLSGLARAFFHAGARNLLASHWVVVDDVGPRLTVRTIELVRDTPGLSRAEALQRAMREVRESPENEAWAHPAVWAPFSLIGDAGG